MVVYDPHHKHYTVGVKISHVTTAPTPPHTQFIRTTLVYEGKHFVHLDMDAGTLGCRNT